MNMSEVEHNFSLNNFAFDVPNYTISDNITLAKLVIAPSHNQTANDLPYGLILFFLQYMFLFPIIFIFWYTLMRIFRAHGLINRTEANYIMNELPTLYGNSPSPFSIKH